MNGSASNYVFGYGSLINRFSVATTIPRDAQTLTLLPAMLQGYIRVWNMVVALGDAEGHDADGRDANERNHEAVFLNIEPAEGVQCWGTLVEVSEAELALLDKRERGYDRVDVTHLITPRPGLTVYTYIDRPEHTHLSERSVILAYYQQIIEAGLREWGTEARELFEASTRPHALPTYEGSYTFPHLDN